MSDMLQQFGTWIKKIYCKSVEAPTRYTKSAYSAALSLASLLLEMSKSRLLPDLNRIKEANIKSIEADADLKEAEANAKAAEAAEASNRATLHKRRDKMAKLEFEAKRLELAKTEAEIEAIKSDSESKKIEAMANANARVIEAISKLNQEGGQLIVNSANLHEVLNGAAPLNLEAATSATEANPLGPATQKPKKLKPKWDTESRTLTIDGQVVKQFKWPSPNQEIVLATFEKQGWPEQIDDPLPKTMVDSKRRLHDTYKALNRNQINERIKFRGDGTGRAVRWEFKPGPPGEE